jgi:methyl-accepting chemotaxis protein
VDVAEKAGKLLDEIVPRIKKTSDLVQEIAAASVEQSSGVSQINTAVNQLSQTTQQNASSSEELAATSEEMSGQAELLQQMMAFFKLDESASRVSGTAQSPARSQKVTNNGKSKGNGATRPASSMARSRAEAKSKLNGGGAGHDAGAVLHADSDAQELDEEQFIRY